MSNNGKRRALFVATRAGNEVFSRREGGSSAMPGENKAKGAKRRKVALDRAA